MKKPSFFFSLLLIFVHLACVAQTTLSYSKMDEIDVRLRRYRDLTNEVYDSHPKYIVSRFTFRSLIKQDFSKITIGENSFSKIGRFAAVNFDSDESRFYFTPFTFIVKNDPFEGAFRAIHSIDFSGEVNSTNIFDFKQKKSLRAGYSYTRIFDKYSAKQGARNTSFHKAVVDEVYKDTRSEYQKMTTSFSAYLDLAAAAEDEDKTAFYKDIKKRFFKNLESIELKYYDDKWTVKRIAWVKFNLTPFSWDNFLYVDQTEQTSYSKPIDKSVYTANAKLSGNILFTYPHKRNMQLYLSGFLAASNKHSLSEIASPSQWQQSQLLTDSTFIISNDEKVYRLINSDFKTGIRPDVGGQLIFLINTFNKTPLGLDLATSFNGLVGAKKNAYVNKTTIGLVVPFLDKSGESTVNLEFFYQRKSYKKMDLESEELWGIKFGLPFHML
ncbi:hypothetical protein [Pedobacter psychroterrae]|uniref:Uncharacterized protein n=1 Tax=Pedobacter psychroterrae TaxID=2530453 RepID=A0A4R0NLQ5_9SPHI|nr:hypothetical protein [Pedobacter psychroterrae]TCC99964.1 hypothetical protein EZ437_17140 [Pedobacter psychroterrae]